MSKLSRDGYVIRKKNFTTDQIKEFKDELTMEGATRKGYSLGTKDINVDINQVIVRTMLNRGKFWLEIITRACAKLNCFGNDKSKRKLHN